MSILRVDERRVISDGRVSCPSGEADRDVEVCLGCKQLIEIYECSVGKVVRCTSAIQPRDLEPL